MLLTERRTIMIFYHYTAREHLPSIAREGLSKGEVAVTPTLLANAVWLTTDPDPAGHGLSDARELTPAEKWAAGIPLHRKVSCIDKRAIAFRTVIPSSDRKLVHWPKWARKRLEAWWYEGLHEAGGRKSDAWWLYWGTIPAEALEGTDLKTGQPLPGWPDAFRSGGRPDWHERADPAPIPAAGDIGRRASGQCGVSAQVLADLTPEICAEVALTTP
jgi:hypothetical protein